MGTSLPSGWTRTYTPSATPIDPLAGFNSGDPREDFGVFRPSWWRVQPVSNNTAIGIHKQFTGGGALPDGLYLCRMKITYRFTGSLFQDDASVRMMLCASSAGAPDLNNSVAFYLSSGPSTSVVAPHARVGNNGVFTTVQLDQQNNSGNHFQYGAIVRNGNVFTAWAGGPSGSWTWISNFTYTGTGGGSPTIDRVYLALADNSTTSPGNMIGAFDFFRYFTQKDLP